MTSSSPPPANAISEHGVIGDLRTVALVAPDGRIDFFCQPDFGSPSLFASLLDPERGGEFRFWVEDGDVRHRQIYLPDTNILISRFLTQESIGEITDFMPLDGSGRIIRRAKAVLGAIDLRISIDPRPDYARKEVRLEAIEGGIKASWGEDGAGGDGEAGGCVFFHSPMPLDIEGARATGSLRLEEGQSCHVVLCPGRDGCRPVDERYVARAFDETTSFWHKWVKKGRYPDNWRELVVRSALTLKLLTSAEHGSIAAAATFGLPETIGGERNWDYRFCWVRDAAFSLYALSRLNYYDEAEAFIHFLMERTVETAPHLQIMYGMDGASELEESELPHLRGYEGSQPVRIGNAAFEQRQMDIYGELMDAIYIATRARGKPSFHVWGKLAGMLDWLCENWTLPDMGIWESRGEPREYLSSVLMSWVAMDRGIRLAQRHSLSADINRWRDVRSAIQNTILKDFWNEEIGAFTQVKGGKGLDAVVLLMPMVRFINPRDPMWTSTLKAVRERLVHDCLVMRYLNEEENPDGLEGEEGAFTICSFWYVEALARTGQVAEARLLFEKLHSYANHLGLYAEELSTRGDHLGNFPQALTHLSLISAAIWLDRALSDGAGHPETSMFQMLEDPDGFR